LEKLNIIIPYKHDETEIVKQLPVEELSRDKSQFSDNRIVFLVRDPRDTVVSAYYQAVKRQQMYKGSISDFIRDERFGIKKILTFHEIWNENKNIPKDFMLLRYEDMQTDINGQVKRILSFLKKTNFSENQVKEATDFGKFDNMHKLEQKGTFNKKYKGILNPTDTSDKTSYKTRKGKVGGFYEDLSEEDLDYCNSMMKSMKNPFYQDRI
jgi:hypothetical protein